VSNELLLVAVGALTGVLAGMLGAGGGFATIVLLLVAGADPHEAVGTSLVYLMVMGGWGTIVHLRLGAIDVRLATALGIGAAAAAVGGAQLAEASSTHDLLLALGLFTACVSGISLAWPQTRRPLPVSASAVPVAGEVEPVPAGPAPAADEVPVTGRMLLGALAGGSAIGLLKGLFGVGAGFLIVPFMSAALGVPRRLAVGSSVFAILVASVVAGLRHLSLDNVHVSALWYLVPGGLVGSFVGSRAARGMPAPAIRAAFLAVMGMSTVYLLLHVA
jgi:hypothetical protein